MKLKNFGNKSMFVIQLVRLKVNTMMSHILRELSKRMNLEHVFSTLLLIISYKVMCLTFR